MIIRNQPPLHLTYCLNVHPGETWDENEAAIRAHTLVIRDRVGASNPFGLGLRLSRHAAESLGQPDTLATFKAFMAEENLYAFTVNGFPYGTFHGKPVKTEVYRPDWSTRERLDYTVLLARILAQLLPEGTDGSISTLPLGYRPRLDPFQDSALGRAGFMPASDMAGIKPALPDGTTPACTNSDKTFAMHLSECALALHRLHNTTGREIHLGLEPEPDCVLETTDDVIRFFDGPLREHGVPDLASRLSCSRAEAETILRRHIGVCFDTCHLAIQFENLKDSLTRLTRHGIRISKVQLSSALAVTPTPQARQRLRDYLDPIYLHQVKAMSSGALRAYPDLPAALAAPHSNDAAAERWRIHFHLPLYFEDDGVLGSTSNTMDAAFWSHLRSAPVSHLEIETYTFHVLPPALQAKGIESSITREFEWTLQQLGPRN